jgi:hypothetical protein
MDSHDKLATGNREATLHNQHVHLRIIKIDACMLHRIERSLLDVVQITSAPIRWKRIHRNRKTTIAWWLATHALTLCLNLLAIRTPLTTDECSPPEVSPVVIH